MGLDRLVGVGGGWLVPWQSVDVSRLRSALPSRLAGAVAVRQQAPLSGLRCVHRLHRA